MKRLIWIRIKDFMWLRKIWLHKTTFQKKRAGGVGHRKLISDSICVRFDAFMKITNNSPNRSQVAEFVEENFAMQDELENSTLPDWKENPTILNRIRDPQYREWAKRLNDIWKTLARRIKQDVVHNPQRHSLIYVNNTFVIPGGRFKGNCRENSSFFIPLKSQPHLIIL